MDVGYIVLLILGLGWILLRNKLSTRADDDNSDDNSDDRSSRPLTQTQRNWKAYMAEQRQRDAELRGDSESVVESEVVVSYRKKVAQQEFIRKNIRPFNWIEWLFWGIDDRMIKQYRLVVGTNMTLLVVIPLFLFGGFSYYIAFAGWVFIDIIIFNMERHCEASYWNDEFMKKFYPDQTLDQIDTK